MFAVDLGTGNTVVFQKNKGVVFDEPTMLALTRYTNKVVGFGKKAKDMAGKAPENINVIKPLREGVISDLRGASIFIKHLIKKISKSSILKPIITVSVPFDITYIEKKAVIEAGIEGGAKAVYLLEDPFSGAVGAERNISNTKGTFMLDMGSGVTEVSLLSLDGIVISQSLRAGGDKMDEEIVKYIKEHQRFLLSLESAEILKNELGNALLEDKTEMRISAKNLNNRMPEIITIDSHTIHYAIAPILEEICGLVCNVIAKIPPEFADDIFEDGILVTGGVSLLKNIDIYLSKKLGIPVNLAKNPLQEVAIGAGKIMTTRGIEYLKNSA